MSKPLLSIILPMIPGRFSRLKAIISRLSLNKYLHPNIDFELVLLDGGSTDETRDVVKSVSDVMKIKYIYVPICQFINAAYPRNIALRACEGEIIGAIDGDHWPSEHMIYGMTEPFTEQGLDKIINRGYVLDSSESEYCKIQGAQWAENINAPLLLQTNMNKEILDVFKYAKIPGPGVNNTLWIWSAKRKHIMPLNGYNEIYCRNYGYSREEDCWRERLKFQGLEIHDGQNKNFSAIHLYHPQQVRNQSQNTFNKKYFVEDCKPVKSIPRNIGWDWGKMIEGSYSIISGKVRDPKAHEEWITGNIKDMPNYLDNPTWDNMECFMKELEKYWSEYASKTKS